MPLIKSKFYLVRQIPIFYKRNSFSIIDNLTYSYTGNQLTNITDAISGNEDVGDFRDAGQSTDYTYYADGSLKSDANKGISNIVYDTYLNKISQIQFTNGKTMRFFYDASGQLLKRTFTGGDTWSYSGDAVYKNGVFYQTAIPEGRIVNNNGNLEKQFYYQDHLGSNRVVYRSNNGKLEVVQRNDYDIWGWELNNSIVGNPKEYRQFQNHEKMDELGWINFGARMYDPTIGGRFLEIDPLAEKRLWLTPYNFVQNNPLNRIDPNGALDEPLYKKVWNYISNLFSGSDATRNTQSVAATTSYTLMKSQEVRTEYVTTVSNLDKTDSQGRTKAKMEARAKTPAVMRELAEQMRPSSGENARVGGTASKTNAGVNNVVGTLGKVGKVAGVAAIGVSVYNVATAENKPQAVATEGGALVGAIAGGELGAETGAAIGVWAGGAGAVPGAIIGGIIGSISGGVIGANAGTSTYNAVTTKKDDKK